MAESLLGGVVRAAGYLSNSDSDSLIDDCARDLRHGKPLIIFPEGTRTSPASRCVFSARFPYRLAEPGFGHPRDHRLQSTTLTKREKWYQIPPRRFHLRIHVLDPVRPEHWVETA